MKLYILILILLGVFLSGCRQERGLSDSYHSTWESITDKSEEGGGSHHQTDNPVPELSSIILLGAGLLALSVYVKTIRFKL